MSIGSKYAGSFSELQKQLDNTSSTRHKAASSIRAARRPCLSARSANRRGARLHRGNGFVAGCIRSGRWGDTEFVGEKRILCNQWLGGCERSDRPPEELLNGAEFARYAPCGAALILRSISCCLYSFYIIKPNLLEVFVLDIVC